MDIPTTPVSSEGEWQRVCGKSGSSGYTGRTSTITPESFSAGLKAGALAMTRKAHRPDQQLPRVIDAVRRHRVILAHRTETIQQSRSRITQVHLGVARTSRPRQMGYILPS